jgi:AmiR/NasT family two-component response regulator
MVLAGAGWERSTILCIGYAERVSQEMAKDFGIREVIIKPFKLQRLGMILKKILEQKRTQR